MRELSLHVLDIVENSIAAGAKTIEVRVSEDEPTGVLVIEISDDGEGIPPDVLSIVTDPFFTTRATRKVGLGLPLFRAAARAAGGDLQIQSQPGAGTRVRATFGLRHVDRAPLGDIAGTLAVLVVCNPDVRFRYTHERGDKAYTFDSEEFRKLVGDVPPTTPALAGVIRRLVREGLAAVQRV